MTISATEKSKRIILYNPTPKIGEKQIDISLALLAISAELHKEGFEINIINHSYKDVTEQILKLSDDCLCLAMGMMTGNQIKDGLEICKKVKKRNPNLPIVWGGWHPSILPKQTLENPYIDIIVRGQGQRTFYELVYALYEDKSLKGIKGISFKNREKEIIENPLREIEELDNFPRLPYELIPEDKLIRNVSEMSNRVIDYFTSQGCPYRCKFCADPTVYHRRTSLLSAKRIVEDVEFLVKRYKISTIVCPDTNFFINEKRVQEVCKSLLEKKIKVKWGSLNIRTNQFLNLKEETLKLMEKCNFHSFLVGAESGSQEFLDLIQKDTTVENTLEMTRRCKKYGFKIYFSFMIGLPFIPKEGEKSKDIVKKEFDALVKILDEIISIEKGSMFYLSVYTPYPGSALYENAKILGFNEPKSLEEWGDFTFDKAKCPWVPKKYVKLIDQLEELYLPFLTGNIYNKFKNYGLIGNLAKLITHLSGKFIEFRWKKRFFSIPVEYYLLKTSKSLMRNIYSRKGYKD